LPAEGHAVACAHVPRPRRTTLFPYTTLFRSIAEEYYFSILLDRANRSYLAMCSKEGGMDIEQLAVERPEALAKVEVDPNVGIDDAKAQEILDTAGFDAEEAAKIVPVLKSLWTVYRDEDATLVEVNPLVRTEAGDIVAL